MDPQAQVNHLLQKLWRNLLKRNPDLFHLQGLPILILLKDIEEPMWMLSREYLLNSYQRLKQKIQFL